MLTRRELASSVTRTRPAKEAADLVSLKMAALAVPVRSVSDMRDNPKTLNRSGVYIYKYYICIILFYSFVANIIVITGDIALNVLATRPRRSRALTLGLSNPYFDHTALPYNDF